MPAWVSPLWGACAVEAAGEQHRVLLERRRAAAVEVPAARGAGREGRGEGQDDTRLVSCAGREWRWLYFDER